jgi:hypothetical protein
MTTTVENQGGQQDVQEDVDFIIKKKRGAPTTLIHDATTFVVAPDSNVTVNDTGNGVRIRRPNEEVTSSSSIIFEDDAEQVVTTYGATVTAPDNKPAAVTTAGTVTLINPDAPAAEEAAEAKSGLQLNLANGGITGKLDGTAFGLKNNNVVVDADRVEVKPADEASSAETDTRFSLTRSFNRVILEGVTQEGEEFKVRIDVEDKGSVIYGTAGYEIRPVQSENTGVNGAAIEADENKIHLTLAQGREFDIDMATGKVTAYGKVRKGSSLEEAPYAAATGGLKLTLSQDGTRVGLDGAGLEKTADGTLAATTNGVSQLASALPENQPPTAEELAALAAKEANAYKGGWYDTGIESPIRPGMIMVVATEDLPGTQTKNEAQQVASDSDAALPVVHEMNTLTQAFNKGSIPGARPLDGKNPDQYHTADLKPLGRTFIPVGFRPRKGTVHPGDKPEYRHTRLVRFRAR